MASYDPSEIQSTVDKLVTSTIVRGYDTLGTRRTTVTLSQVQESAAGVFLLYPKTPFYLASLASKRLVQRTQAADAPLQLLLTNLRVLRRRVLPVSGLSSLANAAAALGDLEGTVSKQVPKDASRISSYQRVQQNLAHFLTVTGPSIKEGGQIVPTPDEARGQIPAQVSALLAQITDLKAQVLLLARSIDDYGALNLPEKLAVGVVQKARQLLSSRVDELSGLGDAGRLAIVRSVILDVLGIKATVQTFTQFTPPSSTFEITGYGVPYADRARPATAARLLATQEGPYALVSGPDEASSTNLLSVWVDGAPSYPAPPSETFYLPVSLYARLDGTASEPFEVTSSNNQLKVSVSSGSPVTVPLTLGSGRTAAQVSADLTTGLASVGFRAEPYFAPLAYDGGPVIAAGNTLTLAFGAFPASLFSVGDLVLVTYGSANVGELRAITVLPTLPGNNQLTVDGAPLTGATDLRIQVGGPRRKVRILPVDKEAAITTRATLKLLCPTTKEQQTGYTLGLYGELYAKSLPTDAVTVADYLSANSQKIRGVVVHKPDFGGYSVRSDPGNPFRAIYQLFSGQGTYPSGSLVQVLFSQPLTLPDVAPLIGHRLVLRGGNEPGTMGTVLGLDGQGLSVSFDTPVTAANGVFLEVGPSTGQPGQALVISSGANQGTYLIDAVDSVIPFQFQLRQMLPRYKDGENLPVVSQGDLGPQTIAFESRSTTVLSRVEVRSVVPVFFDAPSTHAATGMTRYFRLPSVPGDLSDGDVLEFYEHDTGSPLESFVIESFDEGGVLTLDQTLDSTVSWLFGGGIAPPFARLRKTHVYDFESFSAELRAWATFDIEAFFLDLNRLVNPLLRNGQPSDSDVGTAEAKVRELYAKLTLAGASLLGSSPALSLEGILGTYEASPVPEADAMIRAFRESGADRALDMLLSGQFRSFFGLDQESTSYAGDFQKKLRAVATQDMPVRKENRLSSSTSPLAASTDSPDYEFDTSDTDDRTVPVGPTQGEGDRGY